MKKPHTGAGLRAVAILLLACGVLAILPASVLGEWVIRTASAFSYTGKTGDRSVAIKYFAEDMYTPPQGDTLYNFYEYDPTVTDGTYTSGTALATGQADKNYTGTLTSYNVTNIVDNADAVNPGTLTTPYYCTCSAGFLGSSCSYENADNACVDLCFDGYGISSYTVGSLTFSNLFSGQAPTYSKFNAYTYRSSSSSSNVSSGTVTQIQVLENGMELVISINYTVTITGAGGTNTTSPKTCNVKHSLFGSTCTNPVYRYTATASIATTATYTAYVREEASEVPGVWFSGLQQIMASDATNDGVLYTVEGLYSDSIVTLPSLATLQALIPSATEADQLKYDCLLYPIGYYTDVDLTAGSRGTPVTFPLTDLPEGTTTVWIEWGVSNPKTEDKTDINELLVDATSGTVISIYGLDASATGFYTVKNDIAYLPDSNAFGLYQSIPSGVTLKLCLNDHGATNVNAASPSLSGNVAGNVSAANTTVTVTDNVRNYTVTLQSDISVSGVLEIGGYTGVVQNSGNVPHGLIIEDYVALDLNGHTLTVQAEAELSSYGYIYDSVGTGRIVVEAGGRLSTPCVIYGWTGGTSSIHTYAIGHCPFEDYSMPYVETEVELKATASDAASLLGRAIVFATSDNIIAIDLLMAGAPADSPVFSLSLKGGETEGGMVMSSFRLDSELFYDDNATAAVNESNLEVIQNNCLDLKNSFTFENVEIVFRAPKITVTATIIISISLPMDLSRVRFPVSPLLDITCKNSNFTLNQALLVMPGSTTTFDERSVLRLGYEKAEKTTFSSAGMSSYKIEADSFYLTGGFYVPTYNYQSRQGSFNGSKNGVSSGTGYTGFWNAFGKANVNIYGHIEFKAGNKAPYVLSGNINASAFSIDTEPDNLLPWSAENLTAANLSNKNVALCTFGAMAVPGTSSGDAAKIYHYYTAPMINNGTAYVVDAPCNETDGAYTYNGTLVGRYNDATGILTKSIGLGCYSAEGEKGAYTEYLIDAVPKLPSDRTTLKYASVVLGVSEQLADLLVTASNGKQYVFYAGLYHPLSATVASGATSCTIDGTYFISGGQATTLTWSGTIWKK